MLLTMIAEVSARVALALSIASNSTGADLDYLTKTAARESDFRVDAQARTSTASGLFQFIESTWLRSLKEDGPRFGLQEYADQIFVTRSGKYYVPDPDQRDKILRLRHDPHVSALMAGVYAKRNAELLGEEIGRKPTAGELYLAHFLGPRDAVRMILIKQRNPWEQAAANFPDAAMANRSIFFSGERMLSVGEVYDRLTASYRKDRPAAAQQVAAPKSGGTGTAASPDSQAAAMPDSLFASVFGKQRRRETFRIAPDGSWISMRPGEAVAGSQGGTMQASGEAAANGWVTSIDAGTALPPLPDPMGLNGQRAMTGTASTSGWVIAPAADAGGGETGGWQFEFGGDRRSLR